MHPIQMSHFAAQHSHFLLKVSIELARKMFHAEYNSQFLFYVEEHKNLENSCNVFPSFD